MKPTPLDYESPRADEPSPQKVEGPSDAAFYSGAISVFVIATNTILTVFPGFLFCGGILLLFLNPIASIVAAALVKKASPTGDGHTPHSTIRTLAIVAIGSSMVLISRVTFLFM